jgi:hypothetical protein
MTKCESIFRTGGRGIELHLLHNAAWEAILPEEKLQELMAELSKFPKDFGLEHGLQ